MNENYLFPRLNVAYTAIPKNGNTSVKNFLFNLEQSSALGTSQSSPASATSGMGIHRRPEIWKLRVPHFPKSVRNPPLKLVVVRDPVERVLSAWVNKFVHAQHDFSTYSRWRDQDFVPCDFDSLEDLRVAFEVFTRRLAGDADFLLCDNHWKPQYLQRAPLESYDLVVDIAQLDSLPILLELHIGKELLGASTPMPKFNQTVSDVLALVSTPASIENIKSAYGRDYLELSGAGITFAEPEIVEVPGTLELRALVAKERIRATELRAASEVASWRNLSTDILNSRSWRYTAWIRWIVGSSDRRRLAKLGRGKD